MSSGSCADEPTDHAADPRDDLSGGGARSDPRRGDAGRYDPKVLRSIEKVHTAQVATRSVGAGECIQIATGAPMPQGADAVVMVEETERVAGSDDVRILTPVYPGQHVGRRAADITAGQPVLEPGDILNPSRIGALAAVGTLAVDVYARPRIAILSTGNEIVEPGQPLG